MTSTSTVIPHAADDDAADHGREYRTTCDECSRSFPDAYAFADHLLRLDGPGRRYACDVCWRTFSHRLYLKEHATVHTGHRSKHKCDLCAKSLSSARNLRRHVSQVHGEKTYGRDSERSNLVDRARDRDAVSALHVGATSRFATVIVVPQSLADSSDLEKQPGEAFRGNGKRFKCPVCCDAFARRRTLNHHVMNYHLLSNRLN